MEGKNKLIIATILFLAILGLGTAGYTAIEGWKPFDSLFMTVITLFTVGYGEVRPLSDVGRGFTIFIIISGISTGAYLLSSLTESLVGGFIDRAEGRKQLDLEKRINATKNHFIICGFGRMGRLIAKELKAHETPFVVIDNNKECEKILEEDDYLYIIDQATEDETLINAGVERAKGLIAVTDTDANNLYICLTARQLSKKLYIIARIEEVESERKFLRAGANKVVSPYLAGGITIAHAAIRPAVVGFLDFASKNREEELFMEEITISPASKMINRTLRDSDIRNKFGLVIIGIKPQNAEMIFNPPSDYNFKAGDTLITIGDDQALTGLTDFLNKPVGEPG